MGRAQLVLASCRPHSHSLDVGGRRRDLWPNTAFSALTGPLATSPGAVSEDEEGRTGLRSSFWGQEEAREAWTVPEGTRGLLSCVGCWGGDGAVPGHQYDEMAGPAFVLSASLSTSPGCPLPPLPEALGSPRVSCSYSGLRGLLVGKCLAKIKWSHRGTPPGEQVKAAASPGRGQGAVTRRWRGSASGGSAARRGRGGAAGTWGQRGWSAPSSAPLRPRDLGRGRSGPRIPGL